MSIEKEKLNFEGKIISFRSKLYPLPKLGDVLVTIRSEKMPFDKLEELINIISSNMFDSGISIYVKRGLGTIEITETEK